MEITLTLDPKEEQALRSEAQAQGVDVETALRRIIAQLERPAPPVKLDISEKNKAVIALLDAWRAEDALMTDEERTEADRDLAEFKGNINRWRTEEGRPPAFL